MFVSTSLHEPFLNSLNIRVTIRFKMYRNVYVLVDIKYKKNPYKLSHISSASRHITPIHIFPSKGRDFSVFKCPAADAHRCARYILTRRIKETKWADV